MTAAEGPRLTHCGYPFRRGLCYALVATMKARALRGGRGMRLPPSARGEIEITAAIQTLVGMGSRVESRRFRGWWQDTGTLKGLLRANRLCLNRQVLGG